MRKNLLITSIIVVCFSIAALAFKSWEKGYDKNYAKDCNPTKSVVNLEFFNTIGVGEEADFVYSIGNRFTASINKKELTTAKTLVDLLPKGTTNDLASFKEVKISKLNSDTINYEINNDIALSISQKNFLNSMRYTDDFYIQSYCKKRSTFNKKYYDYNLVYYVSITPEQEASYGSGESELINYLKRESKVLAMSTNKDSLEAGRISFIVNKEGNVEDVALESSSEYNELDDKMILLIKEMPDKWNAAKNHLGESVEQKLVFFYGVVGC